MILRKPYAVFIKLFRPIHFIVTILLGVVSYKFYDIYLFFKNYVRTGHYSDIRDITTSYVNTSLYLCILLLLLFFGLIIVLFLYKKKNVLSYIILFLVQLFALVFAITTKNNLILLDTFSINVRIAVIIRDVAVMLSVFNTFLMIWMFLRALGFNLKQFEFNKDLRELQIESNDNEEFEFSVDIDKNDIKTRWNKIKRLSRYYFSEYKKILIIIVVIVLFIGGLACFTAYLNSETFFGENVEINHNDYKYKFKVIDSYLLDKDYKGNTIGEGKYKYVVVRYELTNKTTSEFVFDLTTAVLNTSKSYANIMTMYDSFRDIGVGYNGQKIKPDVTGEFIMVYPIDIHDNSSKFILRLFNGNTKFAISLNPKKLNKVHENGEVNINEELSITNSILPKVSLKVSEYMIDNPVVFKDKGTDYAVVSGSKDKTILMIKYDYAMDTGNIYKISNKMFFASYAKVKIEVDGKEEILDVVDRTPNLLTNASMLAVDSKIKDATSITLVLTIRNEVYYYSLKK